MLWNWVQISKSLLDKINVFLVVLDSTGNDEAFSWGDVVHNLSLLKIEPPKPVLLPTIVLKNYDGKNICKTDTTPIIRYLEEINKTKSVIPHHPVLNFLNYLLEDYADEWVTKFMFHYRWHFEEDAENAGTLLPLAQATNLPDEIHQTAKKYIYKNTKARIWSPGLYSFFR